MYRHISSMKCKLQLYKCNVVLLLIVEEKITLPELFFPGCTFAESDRSIDNRRFFYYAVEYLWD